MGNITKLPQVGIELQKFEKIKESIDEMKKTVADLKTRITKLEKKREKDV